MFHKTLLNDPTFSVMFELKLLYNREVVPVVNREAVPVVSCSVT